MNTMNEEALGMFAGLVGVIFIVIIGLVIIGLLAFWIWMLIDCVQRPFAPNEQNAKVVWILVIVLAGWLGALIYYFVVKRAKPPSSGAPATP